MTLRAPLRIAALGCILASLPLAVLKYPWLPATVVEFVELRHDPAPWGTPSYHQEREARRERVELALLLYCLGTVSLCGLSSIVAKVLPWWAESATWAVTTLTGFGIARFDRANIGPETVFAYTILAMYVPLGVAIISAVAAVASIGSHLRPRRASSSDKS